jgi:hypothetical protein
MRARKTARWRGELREPDSSQSSTSNVHAAGYKPAKRQIENLRYVTEPVRPPS